MDRSSFRLSEGPYGEMLLVKTIFLEDVRVAQSQT
jgi:hypothetical protein